MRLSPLTWILCSSWLVAGCGARTSEDDLLGYWSEDGSSVGGRRGDGGGGGFETGGGFSTGGAVGGGGSSSCCVTSTDEGCIDARVESCVCSIDDFCCAQAWDQACVDIADGSCAGNCSTGGAPGVGGSFPTGGFGPGGSGGGGGTGGVFGGDCCNVHGGVGCGVPPIMECVCFADPYCCENSWDQICVNEAIDACGADCNVGSGGSSTGGALNTGGTAGAGGSTGGSVGVGGSIGTGGSAGQCDVVFPDACGNCLCNDCFGELNGCLGDFGCLAIFGCIEQTGCSGAGCLGAGACGPVINSFGGILGASAGNAFALMICSVDQACPCD
jgi:hypothetical protein